MIQQTISDQYEVALHQQIIKIFQLESAEEISIWFLIIQLIVSIILLAYGILLDQLPITIPQSVLIAEKIFIIIVKYVYHFRKQRKINKHEKTDSENVIV